MATSTLKPQTLRSVLFVVLLIAMAAGLGLFYLGLNAVREYAVEVNHSIADAEASNGQVDKLRSLKGQLAQSETLIAKANQMFATPDNYQNQAITDTRNYANAAGLTIAKITFDDVVPGTSPAMTLSLRAPVAYSKLVQFLDGIEGNIPKMRVSNIGISHAVGGNADSVTVEDIKIIIATR